MKENRSKIIEVFNYACPGCYDLQQYMFFWKKDNLIMNKKIKNYYLPINLYNYWFFLSKSYFLSVRLNLINNFHSNIFYNIHHHNKYEYDVKNIKMYFLENNIHPCIFNKTINSRTILKDVKNSQSIKKSFFLSATPSLLICLPRHILNINLDENDYHTTPIINSLDNILKERYLI